MQSRQRLLVAVSCLIFCICCETQAEVFQYNTDSEAVFAGEDDRIRGVRNREGKDFILGGLFPIHSDDADSQGARCGAVREERGLERMEAMLYALDKINDSPELLPGIELGYDIRDTCNSETIGLDETIDLIITGSRLDIESCESVAAGNRSSAVPTLGIVGAASSRVSVPVAGLSRLFSFPQISYASSSALLSDRTRYEYFYRTITPDDLQATAMIDILLNFNWTYVSVVFTQDTYGQPGIDEFLKEAERVTICIDVMQGIPTGFSGDDYNELVSELKNSTARVVIVFANQEQVYQLLSRVNEDTSISRNFTWIASDAWARSIELVHYFNETAAGLFGVVPLTMKVPDFQDYISQLTINSNTRNHWFPEFFSAFGDCELNVSCDPSSNITQFSRYTQGNFVPLVIDAVYAFAQSLHNFLVDNCNATDDAPFLWFRNNQTCLGQSRTLDGDALLEYFSQVNFTSPTGHSIRFEETGNVVGQYEILNYQANDSAEGNLTYEFVRVGTWDGFLADASNSSALNLEEKKTLQFGIDENNEIQTTPVSSHCGLCEPGTYIREVQSSCCSICEPCVGENYSSQALATQCSSCLDKGHREMWGNNPFHGSNSCVLVPETFLDHSDPWAIPSLLFGCIGLICAVGTAVIFGIYWKTPVVKSSGREQMVLILAGITCSFLLAFIYVAPPSIPICLIQRLGLWFCFSLMFGALTIKAQRVARIFYGLKHNLNYKPHFVTPAYQIAFTLCIVAAQMILEIVSVAFIVHPVAQRTIRYDQDSEGRLGLPEVVITCADDHTAITVLSVIYESILIALSTVLGVLSFKYPANFNEAKCISFCTFTLLIIWTFVIAVYFATQSRQEIQNAAVSFFVILSAFAILIFIFGPKLFIIVFQPKKNVPQFSSHHPQSQSGTQDSGTVMSTSITMKEAPSSSPTSPTQSSYLPPNSLPNTTDKFSPSSPQVSFLIGKQNV